MKIEGNATTPEAARSLVRKLLTAGGYGDSNGRPPQFDGRETISWPDGSRVCLELSVSGRFVSAITGGYEAEARGSLGAARLARDLITRLMLL